MQHPFPNGRRRREVLFDSLTGKHYESYESEVLQTGDLPLDNVLRLKGDNKDTMDEDDEFDDQFEEDLLDKKMLEYLIQQQQDVENDAEQETDGHDLSSSRWLAYDALGSALERWVAWHGSSIYINQRSFSKGFNGRMCVLRGICEAAEVPFNEHLLAELFHIFFT